MKRAWYLGHCREDIGDSVLLAGDPARVERIAAHLEEVQFLPVSRGLKTITGHHAGQQVSAVAFGMGAPIAAIVLHELADLGVTRFLRVGTAMFFPPVEAGDLIASSAALGFDGTSPSYGGTAEPIPADPLLANQLLDAGNSGISRVRSGVYASFDAFYRDMFGIDPEGVRRSDANRRMLRKKGVVAVDMETSALLAAARALQVSCASLCLATVDALRQDKLPRDRVREGEARMFAAGIRTLTSRHATGSP